MKFRAGAWLALASCGVLGAGASCGPPAATAHAPAPARYTATGTLEPGVVPDDRIRAALDREFAADEVVSPEHVGVESTNGIVTLRATVATSLAKERAIAIAHVVRGVRAVVDRIEVVERQREDRQLEVLIASILANDPVTHGQRIAARAEGGAVELSGEVESYATRRIAEDDVLGIPGADRVTDDLAVFPRQKSDVRLSEAARRTIRDDPWIDDAHVRVWADRGRLFVGGWVGSAAEKARAEDDARMASPEDVDASSLRVDRWMDDGTVRARPPAGRGDREIGQTVLDAYVADPRVHPFVPSVDVRDSVVVLTGVAPDAETKAAAVEDASNTLGVADVRDDMKLMPFLVQRTDDEIRAEVVEAISSDARLRRLHLALDVLDGRVILKGVVHSEADRLHAIATATSAPGVRSVDDGIVLVPELGATNRQGP